MSAASGAPGSRPLRWGFLACGKIAGDFATALRTDVLLSEEGEPSHAIVACASTSAARADAFGEAHGVSRSKRYDNYDALGRDPDVDVVYVSSLHPSHKRDVLGLIAAGKRAIVVEKPMAVNAKDFEEMRCAADATGTFLVEGMWTMHFPAVREARRALEAGEIGDVVHVAADFCFTSEPDSIERIWRAEHAGGGLLDVGVYAVAMACMAFRNAIPTSVVASAVTRAGVDVTGGAVLRYDVPSASGDPDPDPDRDRVGGLAVLSWGVRAASAEVCRISGTRGSITIASPMHCPTTVEIATLDGSRTTRTYPLPKTGKASDAFVYRNSEGLAYEAAAVKACLDAGAKECPEYDATASRACATIVQRIRDEIGVRYDCGRS